MKVAVIPGKFNPPHKGHAYLMVEASKMFDCIVVAVQQVDRYSRVSEPAHLADQEQPSPHR